MKKLNYKWNTIISPEKWGNRITYFFPGYKSKSNIHICRIHDSRNKRTLIFIKISQSLLIIPFTFILFLNPSTTTHDNLNSANFLVLSLSSKKFQNPSQPLPPFSTEIESQLDATQRISQRSGILLRCRFQISPKYDKLRKEERKNQPNYPLLQPNNHEECERRHCFRVWLQHRYSIKKIL